jgi:hypothetical protein
MKHIKPYLDFLNEADADGLFMDIEDDDTVLDIDIELEDEEGVTLDDEPEETGDYPDERSRPPKLKKKQREANAVKSKVSRELLGPEGDLRPIINKIFKKMERQIMKEARKQGVPKNRINLDKLSIKR